jgi:hypothetical protein
MFRNWFAQGVVTNLVSAAIIAAGGIAVTVLARNASSWAIPTLCGLGASAMVSIILLTLRTLFSQRKRTITPKNARTVVRDCLDKALISVQNSPIDGWMFNYIATISERKIAVGQQSADPAYLYFATNITFTEEDNRALASGPAGVDGVVRAMRIGLAASKIGYAGIEAPLKQITIRKRVYMGETFGEHELMQALYEVESAFVLAFELARPIEPPAG